MTRADISVHSMAGNAQAASTSAAHQPWQFAEMSGDLGEHTRLAQHTASVAKQELRFFQMMTLCFLNHEQRGFERVLENREHGHAIDAVDGVVPPLASRYPRTVHGKDYT